MDDTDNTPDMEKGNMMALVSYGAVDASMNMSAKRVKTYNRLEIVNRVNLDSRSDTAATSAGEVSIRRGYTDVYPDIYNLKHIIVTNPSDDFKIDYVDVAIGGKTILRIYFDFLKYIKKDSITKIKISEEDCAVVYDIPWHDMGYTDIVKLVALQFHEISFKVVYAGNYQKLYIAGENILCDNEERRFMARNSHASLIKQQIKQNIEFNDDNNYTQNLNIDGHLHGIFVMGANLDNVTGVQLIIAGQTYLNYDRVDVVINIKKIDENCFYFPFNMNKDGYFDTRQSAYFGVATAINTTMGMKNNYYNDGINFSKLIKSNMGVVLKIMGCNFSGNIYALSTNSLKTASGLGGLISEYIPYVCDGYKHVLPSRVLEGNSECCVTCNTIRPGDRYIKCVTCEQNFSLKVLYEWVRKNDTCPHCRQAWGSEIIYINEDSRIAHEAEPQSNTVAQP